MSTYIYGIDFGTSNSSITIWDVERRRLVRDPRIEGFESSFMYFPYQLRRAPPLIGDAAKIRYVQDQMRGRFFQAIKTILPNRTFTETIVNNIPFTLEDLIAFFLTGGTSLIRSLRGEFISRFGADKIRDGGEFTSVGDGVALSAPLFFPELHPTS